VLSGACTAEMPAPKGFATKTTGAWLSGNEQEDNQIDICGLRDCDSALRKAGKRPHLYKSYAGPHHSFLDYFILSALRGLQGLGFFACMHACMNVPEVHGGCRNSDYDVAADFFAKQTSCLGFHACMHVVWWCVVEDGVVLRCSFNSNCKNGAFGSGYCYYMKGGRRCRDRRRAREEDLQRDEAAGGRGADAGRGGCAGRVHGRTGQPPHDP
jgi:hypothetical protein